MSDKQSDKLRAQSWCFENNISKEKIQAAWNNALKEENFIISNLSMHNRTWRSLPPHMLRQLIDSYGDKD